MKADPRLLVVWGQYPRWIPPTIFSARQVTLAAPIKQTGGFKKLSSTQSFDYFDHFEPHAWLETGSFDLAEYCDRHRIDGKFDYILVFAEQDTGIFPTNLGAFGCPTILLVGDTHHFPTPISTLISYASRERFDTIVCQFACHHLHWFVKAGFPRCASFPGLITCHVPTAWKEPRDDVIAFVGHTWRYHFHRHVLLGSIKSAGLPLAMIQGTRQDSARAYSRSLISFNCSLNSDINVRNFEILSSRGFLLTEALPEVTGFSQVFRPGEACDTYGDAEELLSKISFYRNNPEVALEIARQGHDLFRGSLAREHVIERFRSVLFDDGSNDPGLTVDWRCGEPAGPHWRRRLADYEAVQELHRRKLGVKVLVADGASWFQASDFLDLPRVTFYSARTRQGCIPAPDGEEPSRMARWDHVIAP